MAATEPPVVSPHQLSKPALSPAKASPRRKRGRTKRRNLSAAERLAAEDRDRENRRLARNLQHAAPAIDNAHHSGSRVWQLKVERDGARYSGRHHPHPPDHPRGELSSSFILMWLALTARPSWRPFGKCL